MSFVSSTFLRRTAVTSLRAGKQRFWCRTATSVRSFSSKSEAGEDRKTSLKSDSSHDDDDSSLIASQFKNQIVQQLWTERTKAKKQGGKGKQAATTECPPVTQHGKTPCASETKVQYPFTTDELLAESYRSPWNTMRLGKLFEDLDALGEYLGDAQYPSESIGATGSNDSRPFFL
jgi:hypothetical protein